MADKKEFDEILETVEAEELTLEVMNGVRRDWTQYCQEHGLLPDTHEYDTKLTELWNAIQDNVSCPFSSLDYPYFCNAMCKLLV